MNIARYPVVTRSGSETLAKMASIIRTDYSYVGKTANTEVEELNNESTKYTDVVACCGDCIVKSWYIIQKGVVDTIKQIGIQYWDKYGKIILEEKIDSNNRMEICDSSSKDIIKIGYKAAKTQDDRECIVKLGIFGNTLLASSPREDKVRCDKALVMGIEIFERCKEGIKIVDFASEAYSFIARNDFQYKVGEIVQVPNFNGNLQQICVPGIHFYWVQFRCLQYFGIHNDAIITGLHKQSINNLLIESS